MLSFLAIKKAAATVICGGSFIFMFFSKIYIQKNFVPDVVSDQFGRESIGVEISLNEGESLNDAKVIAKDYIKEYIEKNTVYHSPDISERYIPEEQLPIIRYD